MKEIKLSFPYPSTSRHNLSQDVATSFSMGVLCPVRIVEVLPGDSHRISTNFSLISNPLVKPLLQGVRMRYCRFWVPRRIYHPNLRSNNTDYDPRTAPVLTGVLTGLRTPFTLPVVGQMGEAKFMSNFQASCLFDYLGIAGWLNNTIATPWGASVSEIGYLLPNPSELPNTESQYLFNAEPYVAYIDICRNYFGDSATNTIAWVTRASGQYFLNDRHICVSPLDGVDAYIDQIQNVGQPNLDFIRPYRPNGNDAGSFVPFILDTSFNPNYNTNDAYVISPSGLAQNVSFDVGFFGMSHLGLCVPSNRPDRFSRLFDTRPLTSQNAVISPSEITISNLSFLSKLQRYLTRRFFGGSRFTDIMYSVFGQKVPHVDSPVLLDVFDQELGTELVASTNATPTQNPGVTGGFMSASGYLKSGRGSARKRYMFNESGYLIDLVYISPRISRTSYVPDFYFVDNENHMLQGNFIPDMNGIGWQQPSFVNLYRSMYFSNAGGRILRWGSPFAFCSEASWQQYRTLPDVCHGMLNPVRSPSGAVDVNGDESNYAPVIPRSINSPFYIFTDRTLQNTFFNHTFIEGNLESPDESFRAAISRFYLCTNLYTPYSFFNDVFGVSSSDSDNIFVLFRYSHHAKRQVSKRFTLSF